MTLISSFITCIRKKKIYILCEFFSAGTARSEFKAPSNGQKRKLFSFHDVILHLIVTCILKETKIFQREFFSKG